MKLYPILSIILVIFTITGISLLLYLLITTYH